MLTPPGDKVAIIPLFDPDKSPGGIWIPEMAKERCDQGVVKYCGPRCKIVKEGDHVIFPGYSGQTVLIEGEGLLIFMREIDVTATISGEALDNLEVPGLYFKGKDGVYFQATYEMAMHFIGDALQNSPWHQKFKGRDPLLLSTRRKAGEKHKEVIAGYFEEDDPDE